MLAVDQLSISFDKQPIFSDVSFALQQGEIACLLGASGCGKTTLLRCIAGFENPNSGKITLNNQTIFDDKPIIAAHERKIGMVFQDYALFPHLTVTQNIAFGIQHLNKAEQTARIDEMLSLINLHSHKDSFPHELSGGQQQRVALVRALALNPSLILLDEPFSNLDVELRSALSKEVRRLLKSQNVSAILVTHDQAEAFAIADNIGVLADGKLQQWANPETLYHNPQTELVAQFIGEGVLVDIDKHHHDAIECVFGKIAIDTPKPSATKALIRPHEVKPSKDGTGIKAQIIDKDFRGGYWFYTLQNEHGNTLFMQTSMSSSHASHQIGDSLVVYARHASLI